MVGLPARGKSYTARHLARYLEWLGYPSRVFNVGERRRQVLGATQSHEFFDPSNPEGAQARFELARVVMEDLVAWLHDFGRIGIFDATNSTRERRRDLRERFEREGFGVLFVEMVADDATVIERNILETKLGSPDYAAMETAEAIADFSARIAHYEEFYRSVEDDEGSYLRLGDLGRHIELHDIDGYVLARIVFFLSNMRISSRPILLTRHGQSAYNVGDRIGGNPGLSDQGKIYARSLAEYVATRFPEDELLDVWTSTLERTIRTAEPMGRQISEWPALDEIDAGVCDGYTYEQINERWPEEFEARRTDKLGYRYPGGESYRDVIQRLDRVIVELERYRTPVLVVAHQAVLRALYAYFREVPLEQCPYVDVPLHTVIELAPHAYGCSEWRRPLAPAVATTDS
ncbi:MAG: broad specificity phosphatase PhoE/predicted kinase [Hyphomicrobiaceae bacterium]|jgi:broad specificity phosphatase PhoE/predicted kinase